MVSPPTRKVSGLQAKLAVALEDMFVVLYYYKLLGIGAVGVFVTVKVVTSVHVSFGAKGGRLPRPAVPPIPTVVPFSSIVFEVDEVSFL